MTLPKTVRIRELGPREGFQTLKSAVSTESKLRLIDALSQTGVKDLEIASFVRPDRVPQMADAEDVVRGYKRRAGVRYTALYLNVEGFERAEASQRLDNEAWLYIAASETFLKKNNNTSVAAMLDEIPAWLKVFDRHRRKLQGLMLSTAFGCNYEGEISTARVMEIVHAVVKTARDHETELQEVCLADTMGRGNPEKVKRAVAALRDAYPHLEVSMHFHDTRGTGMANVYAALEEGIEIFDTSIGGMGGCPFAKGSAGNVPTEDVVYLCEEMGIKTGVDLDACVQAAKIAEEIVGQPLPGRFYKSVK